MSKSKNITDSSANLTGTLIRLMSLALLAVLLLGAGARADDSYILRSGGSTRSSAVSISMDQTYAGEFTEQTLVQWYRFTTPSQPGYTTFYAKNTNIGATVDFYLMTNIEEIKLKAGLWTNNNSGQSIRLDPNTTYYIKAYSSWGATGFFKISAYFAPDKEGNTIATANKISIGQEIQTTLDGQGDVDFFAFTPATSGNYILSGKNHDIPTTITAGIYTAEYQNLGSVSAWFNNGFSKTYALTGGTTYYVKIDNDKWFATGNYHFSVTKDPISIKQGALTFTASHTYTGSAITPAVTLSVGGKTLKSGTDFTVAYQSNVNAGKATITVTGKGEYKDSLTGTFTIAPAALGSAKVTGDQTYTGSALKPAVTVTAGSRTLTAGTDYTVSYTNNVNAGTATASVTGKGNYTGTLSVSFKIKPAAIASVSLKSSRLAYTGKAQTPAPTVKDQQGTILTKDTDYTVSYSANKDAGTASVTVKGKGNYTGSQKTTFTIYYDLNKANITLKKTEFVYTGKAIKPAIKSVTIYVNGKNVKIKASQYTVSYDSNTDCGTAWITITGKGNASGFAHCTFTIKPPKLEKVTLSATKNSIQVRWNKGKLAGKGYYEVCYSTKKKVTGGTVVDTQHLNSGDAMMIPKAGKAGKCLVNLSRKTTYYVWVRQVVNGVAGDWTAVKHVKTK